MFEERLNKTFRERKRATFFTTINCDIKKTKENNPSFSIGEIKSETDLHNIGLKARNKNHWKFIVKQVFQAAYSNRSIRSIHQHQYINKQKCCRCCCIDETSKGRFYYETRSSTFIIFNWSSHGLSVVERNLKKWILSAKSSCIRR